MDVEFIINQWINNGCYHFVLSQPKDRLMEIKKIKISLKASFFQIERLTATQAFHENVSKHELAEIIVREFCDFKQLNGWDKQENTYQLKRSKRDKLFVSQSKSETRPELNQLHNRRKEYLIPEGELVLPLIDCGVLSKEGKVIASMQHKYKQINRFLEMIDDVLKDDHQEELTLVDFGCGKSYLTFILYYYLTEVCGRKVTMTGLDLKAKVIDQCNKIAEKYGYTGLSFKVGDIAQFKSEKPIDVVISLHACDLATDYALYHAIQWKSRYIFAIPCCQHQLNQQIKGKNLGIISRYGLVQEKLAALYTDAIRANCLTAMGYQTQILEFIDIDDTPKNLLIRAILNENAASVKEKAKVEIKDILAMLKSRHQLVDLLGAEMFSVEE